MAAENIYEARTVGSLHGQTWNIVTHWQEKAIDSTDPEEVANQVHNNFSKVLASVMSDECTVQATWARMLHPTKGDPFVNTMGGPSVGAITGGAMPSFVTAVLQQRSGFASRRKRGRCFLPGVPLSYVEDSELTSGAQTTINAMGNTTIRTAFESSAQKVLPVVYSKKSISEGVSPPDAVFEITAWAVNPILGTQRRRRVGHGS